MLWLKHNQTHQQVDLKTSHDQAMEVAEEAREKMERETFGGKLFMGKLSIKCCFRSLNNPEDKKSVMSS